MKQPRTSPWKLFINICWKPQTHMDTSARMSEIRAIAKFFFLLHGDKHSMWPRETTQPIRRGEKLPKIEFFFRQFVKRVFFFACVSFAYDKISVMCTTSLTWLVVLQWYIEGLLATNLSRLDEREEMAKLGGNEYTRNETLCWWRNVQRARLIHRNDI